VIKYGLGKSGKSVDRTGHRRGVNRKTFERVIAKGRGGPLGEEIANQPTGRFRKASEARAKKKKGSAP